MLQKENISKYLLIILGLVLFIYLILFYHKPKSLTGEWFAVDYWLNDQNHWSIDDSLNLTITSNSFGELFVDSLYIIISDSNTYEFKSKRRSFEKELGLIEKYEPDTIKFSKGPELIRIRPTKTNYDIGQFQELLLNSIIEIDFKYKSNYYTNFKIYDNYEAKYLLFPENTLNRRGNMIANKYSKITSSTNRYNIAALDSPETRVDINTSWDVYSIDGLFIMQYSSRYYLGESYIVNETSDSSFSGTLYKINQLVPFSAVIKPTISNEEKNSIKDFLVNTHWKTEVNTFNEISDYSEYAWTYDKRERTFIENDPDQLVVIGKENDILNRSISFRFTKNEELQIYSFGVHINTMQWKISEDGEFLFIYMNDYRPSYTTHIAFRRISESIRELVFDIPIFLEQPDSSLIEKHIHFELVSE